MRTPALVLDGHGRVRLACTRAPGQWRRSVSAETGSAHLVAIAVPPQGVSPRGLVARLAERLGGERLPDGSYLLAADLPRAKRALARAVAGAEPPAGVRRLLRRLARRIRRRGPPPSSPAAPGPLSCGSRA